MESCTNEKRSVVSSILRKTHKKFTVAALKNDLVYYTTMTKHSRRFMHNIVGRKTVEDLIAAIPSKASAMKILGKINAEKPFKDSSEYFAIIAAIIVAYPEHMTRQNGKANVKQILINAATECNF